MESVLVGEEVLAESWLETGLLLRRPRGDGAVAVSSAGLASLRAICVPLVALRLDLDCGSAEEAVAGSDGDDAAEASGLRLITKSVEEPVAGSAADIFSSSIYRICKQRILRQKISSYFSTKIGKHNRKRRRREMTMMRCQGMQSGM